MKAAAHLSLLAISYRSGAGAVPERSGERKGLYDDRAGSAVLDMDPLMAPPQVPGSATNSALPTINSCYAALLLVASSRVQRCGTCRNSVAACAGIERPTVDSTTAHTLRSIMAAHLKRVTARSIRMHEQRRRKRIAARVLRALQLTLSAALACAAAAVWLYGRRHDTHREVWGVPWYAWLLLASTVCPLLMLAGFVVTLATYTLEVLLVRVYDNVAFVLFSLRTGLKCAPYAAQGLHEVCLTVHGACELACLPELQGAAAAAREGGCVRSALADCCTCSAKCLLQRRTEWPAL